MPTYGYRCPQCSLEFDVWQRMTDEAVSSCPSCGAVARRLFFPAGIVFKGSGFYKTDSRAASSATDGKAASTHKAGQSGATGKTDSPSTDAPSKPSGGEAKSASSSSPATSD